MKIYAENLNPKNINFKNINTESLCKTSNITNYIYTPDGIYSIQHQQLMKLIPHDIPLERYIFNNKKFLIDNSSFIVKKDIYNIPYNHVLHDVERIQYKHNSNSRVSMIIEVHNNKIEDIYFEIREKDIYTQLKEEIINYLSLFNNIKQY